MHLFIRNFIRVIKLTYKPLPKLSKLVQTLTKHCNIVFRVKCFWNTDRIANYANTRRGYLSILSQSYNCVILSNLTTTFLEFRINKSWNFLAGKTSINLKIKKLYFDLNLSWCLLKDVARCKIIYKHLRFNIYLCPWKRYWYFCITKQFCFDLNKILPWFYL